MMTTRNLEAQIMTDVYFPAPNISRLYAKIQQVMGGAGRYYHTMEHITHMFDELRSTGIWKDNPLPFEVNLRGLVLAIGCHDLVQDHGRNDNEEKSAENMVYLLKVYRDETTFIHAGDIEVAKRLIMATIHDGRQLLGYDEQLIHDLDLTILGSEPKTFNVYEQQIRQEYSHIPDESYRVGRIDILENRLNVAPIFKTDFFRNKYEESAHRNIENLVSTLKRS